MKFEIRHADSGHSEKMLVERSAKGEALMSAIEQMYKISVKDQMLVTKSGHIIEPNSSLDRGIVQLDDKTFTSSNFKEESENNNERLACIYLFNLKQLSKNSEKYEKKQRNYWIEQLQDNMKDLKKIKTMLFPYETLEQLYTNQQLEKYDKFVGRINSLKVTYQKLASQYSDLKENSYKVEEIIDRCGNQKKAGYCFLKNIKEQGDLLLQKTKIVGNLKQKLQSKFVIDDKSLRENSSFFENKKAYATDQQKYKLLKDKIEKLFISIKEELKSWKANFRANEPRYVNFGSKGYSKLIDSYHQSNRRSYDQILGIFSQLIQKGGQFNSILQSKLENLEENAKNVLFAELQKMLVEIGNSYIEFCEYNEENKFKLRSIYTIYRNMTKELKEYYSEIITLQSSITMQIEREEKNKEQEGRMSEQVQYLSKKISRDGTQAQRRLSFYKVINFIQSLASKICEEQQAQRKKFVSQMKSNEKYEYECLKNTKVPEVDIEDNNSSDKELQKLIKPVNQIVQNKLGIEQFAIYNYNLILEKIKTANANQTNMRIKNLQEILKRAVQILPKVYNSKIDEIIKEKQCKLDKIPQIEEKCKRLEAEIEQYKNQINDYQKKIAQKEELMIVRQRQRCEQLNKERSKYDKLYSDFKSLKSSLNKQSQVNEQLINEILKNEQDAKNYAQLNSQLKELLALKELQIIEFQKKLEVNEKQPRYVEEDLKSAVFNDFGKAIDKDIQKDTEIERLKEQIAVLQKENQQLQEQYDELSAQMRKIITKQTEDIEVQTITEESSDKTAVNDHISINEDITVGQNALFMPFNCNIYVGVTHKDDDRTVSNINRIQPSHYLLDIASFNLKTKELLTQCSFLVVVQVTSISKEGKNSLVKGQIKSLLGFEDDNFTVKNYAQLLPL